ncbi:MAG TPA: succinate dehydrogenase, hydrophobic membrane anchor protein [Gammaproteobacteria bacterium]|nr:succinate dehydrogenase, hydrophobic membrane anchor protein [Gammaproteobacteria bacterium]
MSIRAQGMRAWLLQRLSGAYIGLYLLVALFTLATGPALDYARWHSLLSRPAVAIASLLFFFFILVHAWVGIRDVLLDYVQFTALRFSILIVLALGLLTMGIWVSMILFSVVQL